MRLMQKGRRSHCVLSDYLKNSTSYLHKPFAVITHSPSHSNHSSLPSLALNIMHANRIQTRPFYVYTTTRYPSTSSTSMSKPCEWVLMRASCRWKAGGRPADWLMTEGSLISGWTPNMLYNSGGYAVVWTYGSGLKQAMQGWDGGVVCVCVWVAC